ncbi:MAG TPA: hypothetical protein VFI65_01895 [Streptosporangiaceae bacterium]|nr:hypothetical protein [Streptosporangiaceae bacterium]
MRKQLVERLAEAVKSIDDLGALMIIELADDGIVAWKVIRDQNGTPAAQSRAPLPWSSFYRDGVLSEEDVRKIAKAGSAAQLVYVGTSTHTQAVEAYEMLRSGQPEVAGFQGAVSLDEVLREVITNDPLTRWYELVVLQAAPTGRAVLATYPLFPPGAISGDSQPFVARCARSDIKGTAFAVVATKLKQRQFQLVSVQTAKVPPGSYSLTAELRRPGVVRFHGLPSRLEDSDQRWNELIGSVPSRIEKVSASHLICLIEVNGGQDEVEERINQVEGLLSEVADGFDGQLRVSILSYGSHAVDFGHLDEPVITLCWADPVEVAFDALRDLRGFAFDAQRYGRAAQLECALVEVTKQLTSDLGRPVLVTIGRRPPFPARVDASHIIPCPNRHDWRLALRRLGQYPGITLGAVHEGLDPDIWGQFGRDALDAVDSFYAKRFAVDLQLSGSAFTYVPFPIIDRK